MDRTGDVFILSRRSWQNEMIKHVLALRQEEVRWALRRSSGHEDHDEEAEEAVILDKNSRSRIEKTLFDEYLKEADTKVLSRDVKRRAEELYLERKRLGQRASVRDLYDRSMKSYWRNCQFYRYGGEIWLSTLIATGRVHRISVDIVNEIFAERIRSQAGREPVDDQRKVPPSTVARASPRGQVKGAQHQKTLANQLRDAARHADKRRKWHWDEWWRQHNKKGFISTRRHWQYHDDQAKLDQEADRLWAEAMSESFKAGVSFKGRDGNLVHPRPPQLGTLEHSLQILRERIQLGEVKWPPRP